MINLHGWNSRKIFVAIVATCFVLVSFGLAISVFAYGILFKQWDTPFVRRLAAVTRFPVARAGQRFITYTEYLGHLDVEKSFLASNEAKLEGIARDITVEDKNIALDRAIRIAVVEEMAAKNKISLDANDINRAFDDLIARAGTSTSPEEVRSLLGQYGWTEDNFKFNVVRPALLEDGLRQKIGRVNDLTASSTPSFAEAIPFSGDAFDKELSERLKADDVKRYIKL